MVARTPGQALDALIVREREEGAAAIFKRYTAAMTDIRATYEGYDKAIKDVAFEHSAHAVQELRFRPRAIEEALRELSGAWFCGYVYARAVYGSVSPLKYSDSEEESQINGQSLIDYAEAINIDGILHGVSATSGFASEIESCSEYRAVLKKAGRRFGPAAVLTSWAMGIAIAIAEHERFAATSAA